ncbi:NAD-dependent epimerase/dehydratase family protein, partial [Flavobacterium sp. XS1P32]
MKILLTGATGYIGKRLLPLLVEQGHEIICCV